MGYSQNIWFNPFYPGLLKNRVTFIDLSKHSLGIIIGVFGFTFGLSCMYLAMRGILKLGGFVASGGAYVIAHQAPDWIWIFPASGFGAAFCLIINQLNARKIGGFNLVIWLFPAVFTSFGYNFFYFAFNPPTAQKGIIWSWFICGVVFELMGLIPLIFILVNIFKILRSEDKTVIPFISGDLASFERDKDKIISQNLVIFWVSIINLASIGGGIYWGIKVFKSISSYLPKKI